MRVVEVDPCIVSLRVDFVVETLVWCNWPLGDRGSVAEWRGALGKAVPMLDMVSDSFGCDEVGGP